MTTKAKKPLLFLFAAVFTALLVSATPALASRPHEFTTAFGEKCLVEPLGGCTGAALFKPDGVAVNEASGDVYVVDEGEGGVGGRVVRFSKEGVVAGEFNGSGSLPGEGKAAGSGPGEVPTGEFKKPETIAVDNSCVLRKASDPELTQGECEAADPSNGDVYVVDSGNEVIDKYSPAGEYLGQITGGTEARFGRVIDGVAVDPEGHVWIVQETRVISEYSNAQVNGFLGVTNLKAFADFPLPGGFAIDSKGNFYLLHGAPGNIGKAAKISPEGAILIEELDKEDASSVAVEQTNDNPFVDNLTSIAVFNSEGESVERLGEEDGAKHLVKGAGVGVDASAGSVYVADPGASVHPVVVFGPAQATAPKVEGESFSQVSSNSAVLAAQINPSSEEIENGKPVKPTEYRFEYGPCTSATTCSSSSYGSETPVGTIPPDFNVHAVSAQAEGLQPDTTYHFRAIGSNGHGAGEPGAEVTFTTEGAGGTLVLPDNRGWEMVSPPDKLGALIEPLLEFGVVQAAASGDAITYQTQTPTEAGPQGSTGRVQVLSRRAAASWSSQDITIPHTNATGLSVGVGSEFPFFDAELQSGAVQPFGEFNPALSEEASESTAYLQDLAPGCGTHCFRPLVTGKAGFANVPAGTVFGEEQNCQPQAGKISKQEACGPEFVDANEDLGHVVLKAEAELKPGAGPKGLYEWSGGALSQVNVLPGPGRVPEPGSELGVPKSVNTRRAISDDGSRIAWATQTNLYMRDMGRGESVQLDQAEAGCRSGCQSGGGEFQIASSDGSRVFFTDQRRLTEDSGADNTTGQEKADLYECKIVVAESGELECKLNDLTPASGAEGAAVLGGILGASEDGEYLYFVAKGVLSEAPNARGQSAVEGEPNLYLRHGSQTSFIATLAEGDEQDWAVGGGTPAALTRQPTRVSNSGRFLEFMSEASPTGYDNRDAKTEQPVAEVYLYDAGTNRLECASCEPSGVRPTGVEFAKLEVASGGLVGAGEIWPGNALVAANVPGWTTFGANQARHQPRYLSDEGRLFFDSGDALVPQDSNGTQDVYEYEPPGVGGCSEATGTYSARSGGCVGLISSGSSAQESAFLDASESGDDVFFLTTAKLSPLDGDIARDVYDAHVCTTGSPCITFPTTQSPPCTTEASCKAAPSPQPSVFGAPASATFQGLGNPAAAVVKPAVKAKAKPKTRAQKLAKALKVCQKKARGKRAQCEKTARKKFGPIKKVKTKGK